MQIPSNYISISHQSEGIRSIFGTAVCGMMAFGCLLSSICTAAPPTNTRQLFEHYCFNCHDQDEKKGDLDLSAFLDKSDFDGNWVFENLITGKMPPSNKKQPTAAEREKMLAWLASRQPAHSAQDFRRISRHEFVTSVNDLLGTDIDLVGEIPEDRGTFDFDTDRRIQLTSEQLSAAFTVADEMLDFAFPIASAPKTGFLAVTERNRVAPARRSCIPESGSFREASDTSSLHWCLISPSISLMPKAVCGVIGGASAQAVPTPVRSLPHPFSPFGPPRRAPPTPMSKKSSRRLPKKPMITQTVIHPDAAGIDLASEVHYVAVPADRDPQPVRNFGPTTDQLNVMADWLQKCGIRTVAMEATGVYWIPLFELLEARGLEVCLVNAQHVRHVPGRKSDVQDCQWLQFLHSVGLLHASFRPALEVCAVRTLLRHRDSLVQVASAHLMRLQKALDQMNVLLHRAVTDITGTTGLAILDAIVAGERDPQKLAAHRDHRCKKSEAEIAAALKGDWKVEQLFTLRQSLAAWRFHHQLADECLQEVHRLAAKLESRTEAAPPPPTKRGRQPDAAVRTLLFQKFGVDVTAVDGVNTHVGYTFLTEVGPNLSRFASPENFSSWLGLCPNNKVSGNHKLSVSTRPVSNRLATALRMAAQSLNRVESPLGDWFRRMRAKLGPAGAVTAAAHKLARILYTMIKTRTAFDPAKLGNPALIHQRKERSLRKQAALLGFSLQPANAGAVS